MSADNPSSLEQRTADVLLEKCSFEELGLNPKVLEGLHACGFEVPSPIQCKAIPIGLCGFDLVVQAKSGTGKTLVFGCICLETVKTEVDELQALILSPTREIAVQTQQLLQDIGVKIKNLKTEAFIGGLPMSTDRNKLKGCHIAVGAPGRVKHLLVNRVLNPNNIKLLILDEADVLINETFIDDIKYIYSCLPSKKQIIASSATYSSEFAKFIKVFMKQPSTISPQYDVPVLLGVKQFITTVHPAANDPLNIAELIRILSQISFKQCVVFSNTKSNAEQVYVSLIKHNWPCEYLSSDHSQVTRLAILSKLKSFQCRILVTTDLTARGVDVENVNLVINLEVPLSHATYLHRIGRAGRYGTYGAAITFINDSKELFKFKNVLYKIGGDNISVDILPHDKIPNVWDKKENFEFGKVWGDVFSESSENQNRNIDRQQYERPIEVIQNVNEYQKDKKSDIHEIKQNISPNNKKLNDGVKYNEKNMKNHLPGNETFVIPNLTELQNDMDIFMKTNYSEKDIIENNIINMDESSEIYNRLINDPDGKKCIENIDALLTDYEYKTTNNFTNNSKSSTPNKSSCENKYVEQNLDFITKLRKATSDLKFDTDDSNDEDHVNILRKHTTKETKCIPIKPEKINKKKLDDDRAFLEMIKRNASKEIIKYDDSKTLCQGNDSSELNDDYAANKFRKAVQNVDSDTFKCKENNKVDNCDLNAGNNKFNEKNMKNHLPGNETFVIPNLTELQNDMDIFMKSNCSEKDVIENNINMHESCEIHYRLINDPDGKKCIENKDASLTDYDDKTANNSTIKSNSSTQDKSSCENKNVEQNSDFITKLREATSDLKFNTDDSNDEDHVNILRKHKKKETKVIPIKPEKINKKKLDDDRAFLEMIKRNASKEIIKYDESKTLCQGNDSSELNDDYAANKFRKAVQNVDSDTFKCKENNEVDNRDLNADNNETPMKTNDKYENRKKLQAVRKYGYDGVEESTLEQAGLHIVPDMLNADNNETPKKIIDKYENRKNLQAVHKCVYDGANKSTSEQAGLNAAPDLSKTIDSSLDSEESNMSTTLATDALSNRLTISPICLGTTAMVQSFAYATSLTHAGISSLKRPSYIEFHGKGLRTEPCGTPSVKL
ncbi:probable ATP-dependent RNA helicase ddx20 [Ctenocephalides felis]|uniref:probable ATP-dependent RNA helicase ddx20 n=1 Tax=Ctenocephalides felis TaxID=7515 RepID=UPI000E6E466A|nr:probable ATP-dependent RNA helicase ddx20 [Ctenocephalides felis]